MLSWLSQDKTLMAVGCALYALAFVPVLVALLRKKNHSHPFFLLCLISGFIFQSYGLYLRGIGNGDFPVQNTFEVFQVVAWFSVAFNFVLRQIFKLRFLNFFAAGLALTCSALSLAVGSWDSPAPIKTGTGPWMEFHAGLAIASYAIFGVLALTSTMYLIQDRALARHTGGNFTRRLPSIGQLEAVNTKLIAFGVSLLTVSMAVGVLNLWEDATSVRTIKLAIACTVWVCYLVILVLRRRRSLVGRPFARACITVFLYALCLLWPLTYRPQLPTDISRQSPSPTAASEAQQATATTTQ